MNNYDEKCGCASGEGHRIKGICCDVRNCIFHDGECNCNAGQIAIGPSHAKSCTDTVCATFRSDDSDNH